MRREYEQPTEIQTIRQTYSQDWKNYTIAQNNEVNLFDALLMDLAKTIPEPPQKMGRPRLSLQETLFCAIRKVYSQLSSRRAYSLYNNAEEHQHINRVPNYNAINKFLNREDITPLLHQLLTMSALPLKGVETIFASDSSGFSASQFGQYAVEKYGSQKKHGWVKAHILVGTKTQIVVSTRITDNNSGDSVQFEPMITEAHRNGFDLQEIVADKGYSSRANYALAENIGAVAYIPFRSNATGKSKGSRIWHKMYHYFQLHRETFLKHYHQRSNAESAFNMIKMKFGDKLKSKKFKAQENELLCKFIAHNIVVLIHEMYELGIVPKFYSQGLVHNSE